MNDRIRFLLNRIRERLWVRPLVMCVLSVAGVFLAKAADETELGELVPEITPESIETLLTVISSSMLVIATFAVGSMVSAYASASSVATPRSFSLVVSDDVSQNALSSFIGAFIFSIVAQIALETGYYATAGRFALFVLTLIAFAVVILTFVRWVDRIARLGRLGTAVEKVEEATAGAMRQRKRAPHLGGVPPEGDVDEGRQAICGSSIGYVQRVDVGALQSCAEECGLRIAVAALPGTFAAPGRALAYVAADSGDSPEIDAGRIAEAFLVGDSRTFDEDPRFGLVTLSEIASRALSPAVNDPGSAISVVGTLVRLFALWREPVEEDEEGQTEHDRVEVPAVALSDMFDDAFTAIARDGAGSIEVVARLQKAFRSLASIEDGEMRRAAQRHSRLALARAENVLELPEDLELARSLAARVGG